MKTTIDLPESELAEAIRHSGAKTKTEAVGVAVADYNRRQRLTRLAARMRTFKDMLTRKDLNRMRETGPPVGEAMLDGFTMDDRFPA